MVAAHRTGRSSPNHTGTPEHPPDENHPRALIAGRNRLVRIAGFAIVGAQDPGPVVAQVHPPRPELAPIANQKDASIRNLPVDNVDQQQIAGPNCRMHALILHVVDGSALLAQSAAGRPCASECQRHPLLRENGHLPLLRDDPPARSPQLALAHESGKTIPPRGSRALLDPRTTAGRLRRGLVNLRYASWGRWNRIDAILREQPVQCPSQRIDAAAWRGFYEQARTFLTGHPEGLVGLRREACAGCDRWVYSSRLEDESEDPGRRHLQVSGDLASMKMAESFVLHEDIEHYRAVHREQDQMDLLDAVLEGKSGRRVFDAKTQGYPYHTAILGVAMLAETLFPGDALVSGDITPAQCQVAAQYLREQLGVDVPLPLRADTDRLYAILVGEAPDLERMNRFLYACSYGEHGLAALHRRLPRPLMLNWLASQVRAYQGRITLGVLTAFRQWLNVTQDLDGLVDAVTARTDDAILSPSELASALVATGVTLEPERIAGLEQFDRPEEAPDSVYSQLGNAMLDMMGLSARNCRHRLGLAQVTAYFCGRFPEEREACHETLERETARLADKLQAVGKWANRASDRANADAEIGDGESFVSHRTSDPLSPTQDEMLGLLGSQIRSVWDEWRRGLMERFGDDREGRHRLLIRIAEHHQIALTERGWHWIDAEQDNRCLDLLILLVGKPDNTALLTNLKLGILEHRTICLRLLDHI